MKKNEMTLARKYDLVINALASANFTTEGFGYDEAVAFLTDRKEKSKKGGSTKAEQAKAEADKALMDSIIQFLTDHGRATATEIARSVEGISSTPKATSLLTKLVKSDTLVRVEDKKEKKVFFSVPTESEVTE